MAKLPVNPNKVVNATELTTILKAHFEPLGMEVGPSKLWGADIYVKKSGTVGTTITLKEKKGNHTIRTNGFAPSPLARVFIKPLWSWIFFGRKWKKIQTEVKDVLTEKGIVQEFMN